MFGDPPQTLVIAGNGMVGWKLCQKLVEIGAIEALRIIVFGEEPRPAYDRVHLTDLFSGKSPNDLILSPLQWYEKHGIELHVGAPVDFIDRDNCLVRSRSGKKVVYDRLVLATGARPFVPPIGGTDLPGVFVLRTVEDAQAIQEYATRVSRAAVIGGGPPGLALAKAMHNHLGLDVHVIEAKPQLIPRRIDSTGSELLKQQIERLGVHVHVHKQVSGIEAVPDGPRGAGSAFGRGARVLHFADGARLAVDMVVLCTGLLPRSELAEACGLECAANGGMIVDDHLRTRDPRIFGIGECAVHRGITYDWSGPGDTMVDAFVDNLVGGDDIFEGADRSVDLQSIGIEVATLGEFCGEQKPRTSAARYTRGDTYRKLVMRDGKLIGAVAVGEWANLPRVREAVRANAAISFWDLLRFRTTGNLFPPAETKMAIPTAQEKAARPGQTKGALASRISTSTVRDRLDRRVRDEHRERPGSPPNERPRTLSMPRDDALARLDAIVQLRVEEMAAMKFKHSAVAAAAPARSAAPAAPAAPATVRVAPAAVSVEVEDEEDSGPLSLRSPARWHRSPKPDEDSGPLTPNALAWPSAGVLPPEPDEDSGPLSLRSPARWNRSPEPNEVSGSPPDELPRTLRMVTDDDALARLDAIVRLRVEEMAAMKSKPNTIADPKAVRMQNDTRTVVAAAAPVQPVPAPGPTSSTKPESVRDARTRLETRMLPPVDTAPSLANPAAEAVRSGATFSTTVLDANRTAKPRGDRKGPGNRSGR